MLFQPHQEVPSCLPKTLPCDYPGDPPEFPISDRNENRLHGKSHPLHVTMHKPAKLICVNEQGGVWTPPDPTLTWARPSLHRALLQCHSFNYYTSWTTMHQSLVPWTVSSLGPDCLGLNHMQLCDAE